MERIRLGEEILALYKEPSDLGKIHDPYSGWHDYNLELLKQSFNNPFNEYWRLYDEVGEQSGGLYISGVSRRKTSVEVAEEFVTTFIRKLDNLKQLEAKVELLKTSTREPSSARPSIQLDKSQVFIVHGRDEAAKQEVARFVGDLDLKPIILHEQPSGGRTIIEKIEEYSNVGFAIILYTPCDTGGLKGFPLRDRARQNVVFEHGYLIGKIGRKNVCALVKGDVETPNDISGVV
ncbi:MAG: nucleotide-binding protein, partial [Bacteroidetes bacterium]|nr:nucleotide-binding protein [Bacteroidota bacterium]